MVITLILAPGFLAGLGGLVSQWIFGGGMGVAIIGFVLLFIGLIASVSIFMGANKEGVA